MNCTLIGYLKRTILAVVTVAEEERRTRGPGLYLLERCVLSALSAVSSASLVLGTSAKSPTVSIAGDRNTMGSAGEVDVWDMLRLLEHVPRGVLLVFADQLAEAVLTFLR